MVLFFPIAVSKHTKFSKEGPHLCAPLSHHKDGGSPCSHTHQRLSSVLVIGALHFLGARLVSHLASQGKDVLAVASYESVLYDDELVWYREEQLRTHHGVSVKIANLSNETQVTSVLNPRGERGWTPSEVVFVPPGVDGEFLVTDAAEEDVTNTIMAQSLVELVTVMENLRKTSPCTRVLLVSYTKFIHDTVTSPDNTRLTTFLAWMETFEILVSTYHNIYRIPIGIFRLSGMHGPWGRVALHIYRRHQESTNWSDIVVSHCWYVRDVVSGILQLMQQSGECLVSELEQCSTRSGKRLDSEIEGGTQLRETKHDQLSLSKKQIIDFEVSVKWAASYTNEKSSTITKTTTKTTRGEMNVIFTSYFTSTQDSQRQQHQSPNQFQYMANFYWSLSQQQLRAVVFHDGLDAGFQHRVSSYYPNLTFSEVHSLCNRSTNDARFYVYYKYLREHPEIDKVLLTDISDVIFQRNPFQLMSLLGDLLYVGTDIDIFPNMRTMPWIETRLRGCFGNYSVDSGELSRLMDMETVYNAGTIGGSRHAVLDALTMIVTYLDSTPKDLNCNMPVVNYVMHRHFFDRVFTGFPLSSRFLRYQSAPKGVYLIHK